MSRAIDISLRLPLAEFALDVELATDARAVGIFGPSGCGKTSFLEAVAGWRAVRDGRIEIGGRVLLDTSRAIELPRRERGVGFVPQDACLFPHWSVRKNILAGQDRAARDVESVLQRTIHVLGLDALLERAPATLSGGERQRVALARAVCAKPRILLLDEPLGAVDIELRRRILPYLIRVREAFALPMLFVSHDPTEVLALCDAVAALERGRVRELGPPADVLLRRAGAPIAQDNVLAGRVVEVSGGTARIDVGAGVRFAVAAESLRVADHAVLAIGVDDILVATGNATGLSARNVLAARIARVDLARGAAWVEAELSTDGERSGSAPPPPRLWIHLTPAAVAELRLVAGARVDLVFKANACRVLSSLPDAD